MRSPRGLRRNSSRLVNTCKREVALKNAAAAAGGSEEQQAPVGYGVREGDAPLTKGFGGCQQDSKVNVCVVVNGRLSQCVAMSFQCHVFGVTRVFRFNHTFD